MRASMSGVDAASGDPEVRAAVLDREVEQKIGSGPQPERAIDPTVGGHGVIDEGDEEGLEVDVLGLEAVALLSERVQGAVAQGEALAPQRLGDGEALGLLGGVPDDAEQVAGIDAVRQGTALLLGAEDHEARGDSVGGVAGDRGAEAGVGIVEAEGDEGVVEVLAEDRVEGCALALVGALLLLGPRLQGLSRVRSLGVGGSILLELFDAGAVIAVGTGPMVEHAGKGDDDELDELPGEVDGLGGIEDELGAASLEQAESAFDVGLVLGPSLGGADGDRVVLGEGVPDLGGVVRRLVVEEHGEGRLSGGAVGVVEGGEHGGGILGGGDGEPGPGGGMRVDHELDVERERLVADPDDQLGAVGDGLGARAEGLERAAERLGVRVPLPGAASPGTEPLGLEEIAEQGAGERDAEVLLDVGAEVEERAVPGRVGGEYLGQPTVGEPLVAGREVRHVHAGLDRFASASQPVLEGAERDVHGACEVGQRHVAMLLGELEDVQAEAVAVSSAVLALTCCARVPKHIVENPILKCGEGLGTDRLGRRVRRPPTGADEAGELGEQPSPDRVGGVPGGAEGGDRVRGGGHIDGRVGEQVQGEQDEGGGERRGDVGAAGR